MILPHPLNLTLTFLHSPLTHFLLLPRGLFPVLECHLRLLTSLVSPPESHARADLVPPGSAHRQWRNAGVYCGGLGRSDLVHCRANCMRLGIFSDVRQ